MLNENYFSGNLGEEQSYYLGLLLGDGCFQKRSPNKLGLSLIDYDIVYQFKKDIGSDNKIQVRDRDNRADGYHRKNNYVIRISSSQIITDLKILGVSRDNRELQLYNNRIKIKHYLRGYLDADGCITGSRQSPNSILVSYTSIRINIVTELLYYITNTLRLEARIRQKEYALPGHTNYEIYLSTTSALKYCNWLYNNATILLKRKKDKYDSVVKYRQYKGLPIYLSN